MLQSRDKKSNRNNHEMDSFGFGSGFGGGILQKFGIGFGDDFFKMDDFYEPMQQIESFSKLHKKAHNNKTNGAFYCETFVQSSKIGKDGKPVTEKYYDRNFGQHKQGNTISEKHQAYQNSQGHKRLAEERMLNDKGRKIIKNKHSNGEIEETNHYYNIDPEDDFDKEWNNMNRQIGFMQNFNRLGYGERRNLQDMMQLQYKPSHNQRNKSTNYNASYKNNSNSRHFQRPQPIQYQKQYQKPSSKYRNESKKYNQQLGTKYSTTNSSYKKQSDKYNKSNSTFKKPNYQKSVKDNIYRDYQEGSKRRSYKR